MIRSPEDKHPEPPEDRSGTQIDTDEDVRLRVTHRTRGAPGRQAHDARGGRGSQSCGTTCFEQGGSGCSNGKPVSSDCSTSHCALDCV